MRDYALLAVALVRTHVNPHGGLKLLYDQTKQNTLIHVRTHVNPHGGLKP